MRSWRLRSPHCANALSHQPHGNGRSPVCVLTCCFKWPEVANFFGHHVQANAPFKVGEPESGPRMVLYPLVVVPGRAVDSCFAAWTFRRCRIVFAAAAYSADVCARRTVADRCRWFSHAAVGAGAADVSMVNPVDNLVDMVNEGDGEKEAEAEAAEVEEVYDEAERGGGVVAIMLSAVWPTSWKGRSGGISSSKSNAEPASSGECSRERIHATSSLSPASDPQFCTDDRRCCSSVSSPSPPDRDLSGRVVVVRTAAAAVAKSKTVVASAPGFINVAEAGSEAKMSLRIMSSDVSSPAQRADSRFEASFTSGTPPMWAGTGDAIAAIVVTVDLGWCWGANMACGSFFSMEFDGCGRSNHFRPRASDFDLSKYSWEDKDGGEGVGVVIELGGDEANVVDCRGCTNRNG